MSDQNPPVPDPAHPEQPPTGAGDQTAALPQADGAAGVGAADTAALPPQQAVPAAAVPAPPGWTPPAAAPSGPRRWWDEATSTGGGRAALVAVAVLAALFVVVGMGLTTALVLSHHRGGDGDFGISRGDEVRPGNGMGRGNGNGNGKNKDRGQGNEDLPGRANPANPVNPANPANPNGLRRGAGAALGGAVLHGEFTTNLTGTPTVMVVQTGQVTAYTAGKSLTVKSTDGFEATYTLDGGTATTGRNATALATGVQVRVVAAKDGMKVTALVVG